MQLTFLALLLGGIIGIAIGVVSAVKQYSALDKTVTLGSLIVYSIPEFWLAVMFILPSAHVYCAGRPGQSWIE